MSKPSVTLSGALVKIYINGLVYNEAQSVSYVIDYGEREIYGIDTPFPQEIHSTRLMVAGAISGIRIKKSGGLHSFNAVPIISDIIKAQYVNIRIQDRSSGEDLLFVPNAKITKQNFQVRAKGVAILSFEFRGLVGFEVADRASN
jgi:hypothetical protein